MPVNARDCGPILMLTCFETGRMLDDGRYQGCRCTCVCVCKRCRYLLCLLRLLDLGQLALHQDAGSGWHNRLQPATASATLRSIMTWCMNLGSVISIHHVAGSHMAQAGTWCQWRHDQQDACMIMMACMMHVCLVQHASKCAHSHSNCCINAATTTLAATVDKNSALQRLLN